MRCSLRNPHFGSYHAMPNAQTVALDGVLRSRPDTVSHQWQQPFSGEVVFDYVPVLKVSLGSLSRKFETAREE